MPTSFQIQDLNLDSILVVRDIEFGRGGSYSLKLDLYHPLTSSPPPYPAIVWIHGGAWKTGDKQMERAVLASKIFAHAGFLTVSINYRFSHEALFPAPVHDAKCAVRWLRANAQKYQIDPKRIGAGGRSAGAHLAMMLGTTSQPEFEGDGGHQEFSSAVQAVCSWAGPADLTQSNTAPDSPRARLLGCTIEKNREAYKRASPINYVTRKTPPMLFVHSELDETVGFQESADMHATLQKNQVDSTLIRVKNSGHSMAAFPDSIMEPSLDELFQETVNFFARTLQ